MQKKIIKNIILFCFPFFLITCNYPTSDGSYNEMFAIYLLKNSTLNAWDVYSQPLENLALAGFPFLTEKDLKYYEWSSHSFELKDAAQKAFDQFVLNKGNVYGVPFVIMVGKNRIYFGTFWWAYSSLIPPPCAIIETIAAIPYQINLGNEAKDYRSDQRIYNALKEAGILIE